MEYTPHADGSRLRRRLPLPTLCLLAAFGLLACSEATAPDGGPLGARTADEETSATPTAATQAAARATRPMRITGTVALVSPIVPTPTPCFQAANSVLGGHALHIGRFEGTGQTCILTDLSSAMPDPNPPFTPAGPPPYITAEFTNPLWVLTAPNGDELWLQSLDAVVVISGVDNSLRAEGTHTIIGGTGRFADATGELRTFAINDDGLGPDDFQSEGWIVY